MTAGPRYGFLLPLTVPALVVAGWMAGGGWVFIAPAFVWWVLPALDWAAGSDPRNPPRGVLDADPYYRVLLWVYAPVVIAVVAWGVAVAPAATAFEWVGLALGVGLVSGGLGIVVAHELGHRRDAADRFAAHALLAAVGYMHFLIEHNKGHHARVATPGDPATARAGEGFWRFFARTVPAQYCSAWHIDRSRTVAYTASTAVIIAGCWALAGPLGAAFFVAQAAYAVLQLELVNYVEHYGLARREVGPGRYERVSVHHSWNSAARLSNLFVFNLQRHAHHHVSVGTPYQSLEHVDDAPQLPAGYPAMLQLAAFPPLWRRVMDPRLPR